jgi:hypothetical protein
MHLNSWFTELSRRTIILFRLWAWVEGLNIRLFNFKKKPPILIYQMGKVGSTSLYKTLKRSATRYPVFHIHWFSKKGLGRADRINATALDPIFDMHLRRCKLLRACYDEGKIGKCKIISLVREPIAREVSNLFQDIHIFHPQLLDSDGKFKLEAALAEVKHKIEQKTKDVRYCLSWFDEEFKEALQINIYDYPFDKDAGYRIIKCGRYDILLLKLERLSSCFHKAMSDFLGLRVQRHVIMANTSDKKKHLFAKQALQMNLKLDLNTCKNIYSEPYVRHFYTDREIEGFIGRWCKPYEQSGERCV